MDLLHILYEGAYGSCSTVLKIAVIAIPLMVFLQFIQELNILDRYSFLFAPLSKALSISKEASLSLLTGLLLGVSYGSGVIIQTARNGLMTKRECYLVMIFLSLCHSFFEDTVIFVAIGANPYILFIGRFFVALLVTFVVSKLWKKERELVEPDPTVIDYNLEHNNRRGEF